VVDKLVELAIAETAYQRSSSPDRRPTFAPPITFCAELETLLSNAKNIGNEFEPGYGRLWAVWENPKLTLGKCKGFELRAGKNHDGPVLVKIRLAISPINGGQDRIGLRQTGWEKTRDSHQKVRNTKRKKLVIFFVANSASQVSARFSGLPTVPKK
jgi:hypothetical protein